MEPEELEKIWNELLAGSEIPPNQRNGFPKGVHQERYNCWGFSAYFFGWIDEPKWLNDKQMETLLIQHTYLLENPETGCIVAMWGDYVPDCVKNELLHTALYTGDGKYLHKPGGWQVELSNEERMFNEIYSESYGFKIKQVTYHKARR